MAIDLTNSTEAQKAQIRQALAVPTTDTNNKLAEANIPTTLVRTSQLGAPGGIATLGSDGKVLPAQLPAASGSGSGSGGSFTGILPITQGGTGAATPQTALDNLGAASVSALANKVDSSLVGQPNGLATLGADGKVPSAQLPAGSGSGGGSFTGVLPITQGGTNATTASGARDNLGLTAALANKADTALLGQPGGIATLGQDGKVPASQISASGGGFTGTLAINQGGTGATTAAAALTNLGAASAAALTAGLAGKADVSATQPVFQTVGDANATINPGTTVVVINAQLTAARTYTLPDVTAYPRTRLLIVDSVGLNGSKVLTLVGANGQTIQGQPSYTFEFSGFSMELIAISTGWRFDIPGVQRGGTGAKDALAARANIGAGANATLNHVVSNMLPNVPGQITVATYQIGDPVTPKAGTARAAQTQLIGTSAVVEGGNAAPAEFIMFQTPIENTGTVQSVSFWAAGAGAIKIALFSRSADGNTFTNVQVSNTVQATVGLNTFTCTGSNDFGVFPVTAGLYVAILGAGVIANPHGTPGFPIWYSFSKVPLTVGNSIDIGTTNSTQLGTVLQEDTKVQFTIVSTPVPATISAGTILLTTPVANDGKLNSVSFYANAVGTAKIGSATLSNGTYLVSALSNSVNVVAGLNTINCSGADDFGQFLVTGGQYLFINASVPLAVDNQAAGGFTPFVTFATALASVGASGTPGNTYVSQILQVQFTETVTTTETLFTDYTQLQTNAELSHFLIYGQSLSVGYAAGVNNTTPLTYALRYNGGVRPDNIPASADTRGSLVGLYEQVNGNTGETFASGCAKMLAQLYATIGVDVTKWGRKWLFSTDGWSAQPISNLIPGSAGFANVITDISAAPVAGVAANLKTYGLQAILYDQGESDYQQNTSPAVWATSLESIRSTAQSQAQTSGGTSLSTVPLFLVQVSSHLGYGRAYPNFALKILELHSTNPNFYTVCPQYFLSTAALGWSSAANGVHLNANGYEYNGAYYALAYWMLCVLGYKPPALAPSKVTRAGKNLLITYPVQAGNNLVVDTTSVAAQANLGFTAVDASGTAQTLSNPRLVDRQTIAITTTNTPAAGWKLRYAHTSTDTTFGRGNIRDDNGKNYSYVGSANLGTVPLHNWAFISETTVV